MSQIRHITGCHVKKVVAPLGRKEMACHYIEDRGISIRRACLILKISVTCYYHKSVATDENKQIADLLIGLTQQNKNWGFGLCFLSLRNVLGLPYNHKRVYRIYCELELNLIAELSAPNLYHSLYL